MTNPAGTLIFPGDFVAPPAEEEDDVALIWGGDVANHVQITLHTQTEREKKEEVKKKQYIDE
jgi:hypothetical protein